jgi:hypothetical protein
MLIQFPHRLNRPARFRLGGVRFHPDGHSSG